MTIWNGQKLLQAAPIKNMETIKIRQHGVSYGLSEAGYDIRIKQDVKIEKRLYPAGQFWNIYVNDALVDTNTKFCIASTIEEFQMPPNLVGVVHDKSTWARMGLSVFNTVIEPGWKGFLTLELVHHGNENLHIPAGSGIAQVIFSEIAEVADYGQGKYQNAGDFPQAAIKS